MAFADHFSAQARLYAQYRPIYPDSLYDWLAGQCREYELAWDCATGNGQAARGLTAHFQTVVATDASVAQIDAAKPHPQIQFLCAPAEQVPLAAASVDLVTVAQALHWFDLEAFYREVRRVLKPGGIIAVWSYNLLSVEGIDDALIEAFYHGAIHAYWPRQRIHVEQGYAQLAFPFHPVQSIPDFAMQAQWNLEQLCGYLRSWSAVQKYREKTGRDPLAPLQQQLAALWPHSDETRTVRWPLTLKVGRLAG